MNLTEHQHGYHHQGMTVVRRAMSPDLAGYLVDRAMSLVESGRSHRIDRDATNIEQAGDMGGRYGHDVIDGAVVREHMPELWGWYDAVRLMAEAVTARPVILSPYPLSAVNVKVYQGGDEQGYHYDTNAVTALLYLTAVPHACGTEVIALPQNPDDKPFPGRIMAMPGDLLLMQGRRVLHRVPEVPAGTLRITVPLNLYYPDDIDRPEGIDELVYGKT